MPWETDQDRLTLEARLFLSTPEVVFQELKKLANKTRAEMFWSSKNESLEPILVERNDPLINLGLACFGMNKEVFEALYKHGREAARDTSDAHYKRGLRIGCLSNQAIVAANWVFDFPKDLLGPEELQRVLAHGDPQEVEALICNPAVSDKLLEELYEHNGPFAELPDERWASLVSISSKNERLNTEEEHSDSPDLGHYRIHKAIFNLLNIVPVEPRWFWVLYGLLDRLDPRQVASPERIDHVLLRWKPFQMNDHKGQPTEGSFTSLPIAEEFRCLIGALYGRGFANNKSIVHGAANAPDVALRCAYYGNADLTPKDMKAGYDRDKDVYVYSALYNSNIMFKRELRAFFEEEQLSGNLYKKYLKHFDQLKKRWPNLQGPISESLKEEAREEENDQSDARLGRIEDATFGVQGKIGALTSKLQGIQTMLVAFAIAAAIAFFLRK